MVPKAMLGVGSAGHEGVARLVECVAPGQGIRARLGVGVPVCKTVDKQVLEGGMQDIKGRCEARWGRGRGLSAIAPQPSQYTLEGRCGVEPDLSAVGEPPCSNALRQRWRLPSAMPSSSKRMCPLHEQLEDQHRQSEKVVFRRPVDTGEVSPL